MWWVPKCLTLSSTVCLGLFVPLSGVVKTGRNMRDGCEHCLHGVMCAFSMLVMWNCSAGWWESAVTSSSVRRASLFMFTELKTQIPPTLHSKPRHTQVTFQGNLSGVHGMKDHSRFFGMWLLRLEVKQQKYCIVLPFYFVRFLGRGGVEVSLWGHVCILVLALEWLLKKKRKGLGGTDHQL